MKIWRHPWLLRCLLVVLLLGLWPAVGVGQNGFQRLSGRHLRVITDMGSDPRVQQLPEVFDAAVPLWSDYFQIPTTRVKNWTMTAYVMQNRERFVRAGMLPPEIPEFLHGYQRGDEIWITDQPSPYFMRHLLLHEGTHAVMSHFAGGLGPAWYAEGMAEMLSTHRWHDTPGNAPGGKLQLQVFPDRKENFPYWGRIALINHAARRDQTLSLRQVMQLRGRDFRSVQAYAWSWALVTFLFSHPQWAPHFQDIPRQQQPTQRVTSTLRRLLDSESDNLQRTWQLYVYHLDYGYDVQQDAIDFRDPTPLNEPRTVEVSAQRGWQSSGLLLQAGRTYRLTAQGRCVIHRDSQPWPSSPAGVTIRYHDGRPLGQLLAAVEPLRLAHASTCLIDPVAAATDIILTPPSDGVLYLIINDKAGERTDNEGGYRVHVQSMPTSVQSQEDLAR